FRPRLIVARGLIEALTPEELAASIDHEIGHFRARDNLKRLAMRMAPDVLRWTAIAADIERKWAAASEHAADAGAAIVRSRAKRLALASALVKVARLMPVTVLVSEPISTLVGGGEIATRVRRLINDQPELEEIGYGATSRRLGGHRVVLRASVALAGAVLLLAVGYAPLVETVHRVTEVLVQSLP